MLRVMSNCLEFEGHSQQGFHLTLFCWPTNPADLIKLISYRIPECRSVARVEIAVRDPFVERGLSDLPRSPVLSRGITFC
jgi:hypothetical protein